MKKQYSQLQLPDPADRDPHPRLLLDGYGVHAGESFRALFPDGWHDITLSDFPTCLAITKSKSLWWSFLPAKR